MAQGSSNQVGKVTSDGMPARARAVTYVTCPRCALRIGLRARWLTLEHCPRCLARERVAVELFESPITEPRARRASPSAGRSPAL